MSATQRGDAPGKVRATADVTSGRSFVLNTGAGLEVASGKTLSLVGASVAGGTLRGPGNFAATGGTEFTGVTIANGATVSVTD